MASVFINSSSSTPLSVCVLTTHTCSAYIYALSHCPCANINKCVCLNINAEALQKCTQFFSQVSQFLFLIGVNSDQDYLIDKRVTNGKNCIVWIFGVVAGIMCLPYMLLRWRRKLELVWILLTGVATINIHDMFVVCRCPTYTLVVTIWPIVTLHLNPIRRCLYR